MYLFSAEGAIITLARGHNHCWFKNVFSTMIMNFYSKWAITNTKRLIYAKYFHRGIFLITQKKIEPFHISHMTTVCNQSCKPINNWVLHAQ